MASILIIEDNIVNLELAVDLLRIAGHQVTSAITGEEGVEKARTLMPDLILMDIQLPGISGLEATRILKAADATKHIPIVALTAHAMKHDERRALAAGCDAYMIKPIQTRTFAETVASHLRS